MANYSVCDALLTKVTFPSQRPTNLLRGALLLGAKRLGASRGRVWETLLNLGLGPRVTAVFQAALDEPEWDLVLPRRFVLPHERYPIDVAMVRGDTQLKLTLRSDEDARALQQVWSREWQDERASPGAELARDLIRRGFLVEAGSDRVMSFREPGVYRLQHASLLFRSESATVLIDPVYEQVEPWGKLGPARLPPVDAVLISHAHDDHFSFMSLLQFPRHTKMIVPAVKVQSMLAEDMGAALRGAGFQDVTTLEWGASVRVKDIEIHAAPFFGEQPWLNFPSPVDGLRNVGNTYLLELCGKRFWALVDSGQEWGHSMVEVARDVRDRVGPVDFLVSSAIQFPWCPGTIDDNRRYLFCFPEQQLAEPANWPQGKPMTLGTGGVHQMLEQLAPCRFLPYAHWWGAPLAAHRLTDGRMEHELFDAIVAAGTPAERLCHWQIGECVRLRGNEWSVTAAR